MDNYSEVSSMRNTFIKFNKDISHLSDEEIKIKAEIVYKKIRELNIDVNTEGDKILELTFAEFNV